MRQAIRSLRRSPGLVGIAIASLALGIGANLTVYGLVRDLVLKDVSARRLDRLVRLGPNINYVQYQELHQDSIFEAFAFNTGIHDTNWQNGDHAEVACGIDTSPNFFDVLGIRPVIGRVYSQSDEGRLVAVVSYGCWTRRLHSDPNVVGRALQLNGRGYTVVGVLPSVAHPPFVGFIARLRPGQFPGSDARKLSSSTNNLLEWVLPPLVICAVKAHPITPFVFGEVLLRRALNEYIEHHHFERNRQGKGNLLLFPSPDGPRKCGAVGCRDRLGGLLKFYSRVA